FTLAISWIVLLAYYMSCNIVPQPNRYGVTMDLGLCLSGVFGAAALLRRLPRPVSQAIAVILILAAAVQVRHQMRYARGLIRGGDVTTTRPYHLAKWMEEHMQGQRVFVGGAESFHFNAFTDTPQFHGGHDPMQPSPLTLIGSFLVAWTNTNSMDMGASTLW